MGARAVGTGLLPAGAAPLRLIAAGADGGETAPRSGGGGRLRGIWSIYALPSGAPPPWAWAAFPADSSSSTCAPIARVRLVGVERACITHPYPTSITCVNRIPRGKPSPAGVDEHRSRHAGGGARKGARFGRRRFLLLQHGGHLAGGVSDEILQRPAPVTEPAAVVASAALGGGDQDQQPAFGRHRRRARIAAVPTVTGGMSMILACPSARGAWGAVEVRASPLIWAGAEASPTAAPLLIWGIATEAGG